MHRVVGDRTRALIGALTVAGLCRDLTGLRDQRLEVARYHGGHGDGRCARWRLRSSLTHLGVRSLRCSRAAFASTALAAATGFDGLPISLG
jgi:hypothetical protein